MTFLDTWERAVSDRVHLHRREADIEFEHHFEYQDFSWIAFFSMQPILEIRSRCKGTFVLRKSLKVQEGTLCDLRRNPLNEHGRLQLILLHCFASTVEIVDVSIFSRHCILSPCTNANKHVVLWTDTNCVQIIAPIDIPSSLPYNYHLGERIGNVSREVALVLASVMDADDLDLPDCNIYNVGFKF